MLGSNPWSASYFSVCCTVTVLVVAAFTFQNWFKPAIVLIPNISSTFSKCVFSKVKITSLSSLLSKFVIFKSYTVFALRTVHEGPSNVTHIWLLSCTDAIARFNISSLFVTVKSVWPTATYPGVNIGLES